MRACVRCFLAGLGAGAAAAPVAWLAGRAVAWDHAYQLGKAAGLREAARLRAEQEPCSARLKVRDGDPPWSCVKPAGHPLGHRSSAGHIWRDGAGVDA